MGNTETTTHASKGLILKHRLTIAEAKLRSIDTDLKNEKFRFETILKNITSQHQEKIDVLTKIKCEKEDQVTALKMMLERGEEEEK